MDYSGLVAEMFEKAKRSDRDAQFYLASALEYCQDGYRAYFKRGEKTRTIDEALQYVSTHPVLASQDDVQRTYDRCHTVMENEPSRWGAQSDWLSRATDAGQPAAQAKTALLLINASMMSGFAAAGGVVKVEPVVSQIQDPHALLIAAVQSRDPEVLFRIGELQGALQSDSKPDQTNPVLSQSWENTLAWWLVACNRGYDCESNSEMHRTLCRFDPNCPPDENGVDYIRRMVQVHNLIDVDERAQEIGNKLDAGAWTDLGL